MLTTRTYNQTDDKMIIELVDQFEQLRSKRFIKPHGFKDLSYRDGMIAINPGLELMYNIFPDKINGRSLKATIFPINVFENAQIYLTYDGDGMVHVSYQPANGIIERLRIVRWLKGVRDYIVG